MYIITFAKHPFENNQEQTLTPFCLLLITFQLVLFHKGLNAIFHLAYRVRRLESKFIDFSSRLVIHNDY
tara:strand:- start:1832 stop:2038 length:207 start_codon:yes stop_codon:yes gene_type:complete